ncbi:Protein of unknown function [Fictibacillus enclensis]|uniref:DUF3990 domain-containing protein n=1 Tax=Fictibacillus enclensis TaxID=1017270 RepID=A0A0V8IY69_9BACL|nr:DUF3990 domain-containing protein [Fictibacillus enclensis]KSU79747.1 hypothetical protein AS030_21075 [Fictibacillus enclensis]SCC39409.1 Protein of unknown function [Fictibacillus enclensis]
MVRIEEIINPDTKLYHATTSNYVKSLFDGIQISKCDTQTDFGQGFYLTTNLKQAKKWAFTKENEHNRTEEKKQIKQRTSYANYVKGVIVVYNMRLQGITPFEFNTHVFPTADLRWGDFVYRNRSFIDHPQFNNRNKDIDIVYGPLADGNGLMGMIDDVDNGEMEVPDFYNNILSEHYVLNGFDQLSVHTPRAIETLLWKEVILPHELRRKQKTRIRG